MNYLLVNISTQKSSLIEKEIDDCLKNIPYNSKISQGNMLFYSYILLPIISDEPKDFLIFAGNLSQHCFGEKFNDEELKTVFYYFKGLITGNYKYSVNRIGVISDNDINILYTDGSFRKVDSTGSFACCVLKEKFNSDESLKDSFTNQNFLFEAYNGVIPNGTNNIGELTGIKTAVEHFGKKTYQLIISDSEYSIKTFREWVYNWEENNYRTYSNKPIKNEELIKEIVGKIKNSNKIIFFKWTKGHADDEFNEKCDELAKSALGIKK